MIDFKNATFFKLKKVSNDKSEALVGPLLIPDESVISTYKGLRDQVVFTNKRIISINIQGLTGTKQDYTSMPYSKIQVYSVETAGMAEMMGLNKLTADCELELYFSSVGKVKFEFKGESDIKEICKMISEYVLK